MDHEDLVLEDLLKNIYRLQEFAERKNTSIFSIFSLMLIFAPFIDKITEINKLLTISISFFYILYAITLLLIFLSFFPRLGIKEEQIEHGKDKRTPEEDNLLLFSHICKYSLKEYKSALANKYKMSETKTAYRDDLITQIITNSDIANNKFLFFRGSAILASLAMLQFVICFIISFLSGIFT